MKTHVIQLERHDDFLSAKDKISWNKAQRVLLVWPDRGRPKISALDLNLLDRYVSQLGARLALVTQNVVITEEAYHQGIPVFESIDQARKNAWRVPREWRKNKTTSRQDGKNWSEIKAQFENQRVKIKPPRLFEVVFFILGIMAVSALIVSFIPGTEVIISPSQQVQQIEMQISASPAISSANLAGGVPAIIRKFTLTADDTVQTSGSTLIPSFPASGKVIFSSLSDQEVIIPLGTIVLDSKNPAKRYQTTEAVILGAGNEIEVEVKAVQTGSQGDIEAGQIDAIEGSVGLNAAIRNPVAITGGSDVQGKTVSASDLERLRSSLIEKLEGMAKSEAEKQALEGEIVILDSLTQSEIVREECNAEVDQVSDMIGCSMQIEFQVWVVNPDDLNWAITSAMDASLGEGFKSIVDTLETKMIESPKMQGERSLWTIQADRIVQAKLERETIQALILGKSISDAKMLIEGLSQIDQVEINGFPGWWPWVTLYPQRLELIIQ